MRTQTTVVFLNALFFRFFTFHTPDLFSESWASPFKYADDAGIGHPVGIHKAFPL